MNENAPNQPFAPETDAQLAARFYALDSDSVKDMSEWLGAPGSSDPADPDDLPRAAKDTQAYLASRPAGPEDLPDPDAHYNATLKDTSWEGKTARELVDAWAEADEFGDKTRVNDVTEILADRAIRRAALAQPGNDIERDEMAAHTLNALFDRKERLKRRPSGPPPPPVRSKAPSEPPEPAAAQTAQRQPQEKAGEEEKDEHEQPARPAGWPLIPEHKHYVKPPKPEPSEGPAEEAAGQQEPEEPHRQPFLATQLEEPATREEPVQPEESIRKPGFFRRIGNAWNKMGAAVGTWFSDPEKGKRRRVMAALGSFALGGVAGWIAHHFWVQDADPGALPPVTPEPPPPEATEAFYNNLQPRNYEGQKYEWGAAADDYGAAHATPAILRMIDDARAMGAEVNTWGNPRSGRWGISSVNVELAGGGRKAYFETERKWAILQYLSRLFRRKNDAAVEL